MKRNAVIRIVVWSLVILCLSSILLAGLGLRTYRVQTAIDHNRVELQPTAVTAPVVDRTETATLGKAAAIHSSPSEDSPVYEELDAGTQIAIQRKENISGKEWAYINSPIQGWMLLENIEYPLELETQPPAAPEVITLTEAATVYSSPSAEKGRHNGTLEAGTEVSISRQELINSQQWAYTPEPIQGWILMEEQEPQKVTVTEPAGPVEYTSPDSVVNYGYSCLAEEVSAISIDWVSGNIEIIAEEGNRIIVEETAGDQTMELISKGNKLSISFCEENTLKGLFQGGSTAKDLTITVPKDWVCKDLEIDAASSKVHMLGLTVQKMELDTASGESVIHNCTVGSLEIDTASGDVTFIGTLDELETDAVSAHVTAILKNTPKSIEMNSASGSLNLALPQDTGFTLHMDGMKTSLSSDFDTTMINGAYVYGNGRCKIEMESLSGNVNLRKNA